MYVVCVVSQSAFVGYYTVCKNIHGMNNILTYLLTYSMEQSPS